jgi:hypothetical protein
MMTTKSRGEEISEKGQFWEQQINHWKESGLRQSEFCRRHSLKAHQLTYWKKRFHSTDTLISLVEFQLDSALQSQICARQSPLRLIAQDQYRTEIEWDFDAVALRQLNFTWRQF